MPPRPLYFLPIPSLFLSSRAGLLLFTFFALGFFGSVSALFSFWPGSSQAYRCREFSIAFSLAPPFSLSLFFSLFRALFLFLQRSHPMPFELPTFYERLGSDSPPPISDLPGIDPLFVTPLSLELFPNFPSRCNWSRILPLRFPTISLL